MSKVTPLGQLPSMPPGHAPPHQHQQHQQQQHQQQAPASPASVAEAEDVATIQEVMNHFGQPVEQMNAPQPQQQAHPHSAAMPVYAAPAFQTPSPPGAYYGAGAGIGVGPGSSRVAFEWWDEARTALFLATVVFVVSITPVGAFVARYVPVDRLPHSDALLKSVLAAIAIVLARRYYASE